MKPSFLHNVHAMSDIRMRRILHEYGAAGIGVYWALIEALMSNGNEMFTADIDAVAKTSGGRKELFYSIVYRSDLFNVQDVGDRSVFSAVSAPSIFIPNPEL